MARIFVCALALAACVFACPPAGRGEAAPAQAPVPAAPASVPSGATQDEGFDPRRLAQEVMEERARGLDTAEVESYLRELGTELGAYVPPLTLKDALGLFTGRGSGYDFRALLAGVARFLAAELVGHGRLLGKIVLLAVVAAILGNLGAAFEHNNVGSLAHYVCYLIMVGIALGSFVMAVDVARSLIDRLVGYLFALLPMLLAMLAATGALVSAGLLHPLMIGVTNATALLVKDYVFPVLFLAAIIDIVGSLSDAFKVSSLAALLRQVALTLMGLLLACFLGISAVQGAAGAVGDGVTLRSAKFVANTFIPVVGKMFADASELVIGSSLVLKNAVGVLGAAGLLMMSLFPLLKLVALVLVYRFAAAVIQPLNAGRMEELLNGMGTALIQVLLCAATVSLMFFVGITIVVAAGNMAAMLR